MNEPSENIRNLVDNIEDLPTLPMVITKINQLLQNPKTSAEDVGQAIVTDQALASKVIKLVNSAFYGFPGRINTITHAIVILGFSTVKNIVLTASVIGAFTAKKQEDDFDMEAFWLHSVATGAFAKVIARETKFKFLEEAFIGGLLHDIGKLVLALHLPEVFERILAKRKEKDCLLYDAEGEVLNSNHCEIGYLLATRWNLPADLAMGILCHHDPTTAEDHEQLASIIHLADILARGLGIGSGGDDTIPEINESVWKNLAMDKSRLRSILRKSESEIEKASIFMKLS